MTDRTLAALVLAAMAAAGAILGMLIYAWADGAPPSVPTGAVRIGTAILCWWQGLRWWSATIWSERIASRTRRAREAP